MKYPIKYKKKPEFVKIPVFYDDTWWCSIINEQGKTEKSGFAGHHTEESCWICCNGHNRRVGYSKKDVKKVMNQFGYGKKEEKGKKAKKPDKGNAKFKGGGKG
jgi:hypothetical protein